MTRWSVGFVDAPLVTFRVHARSATASNKKDDRDRFDKLWLWRSFLRFGLPSLLPRRSAST
jgi:hypothetical protein